ncbi:MAG: hypothetical protein Q4B18_06320, partial [Bacillota bacterium]|nr:hypothetical protein [Bacillota bacterium]
TAADYGQTRCATFAAFGQRAPLLTGKMAEIFLQIANQSNYGLFYVCYARYLQEHSFFLHQLSHKTVKNQFLSKFVHTNTYILLSHFRSTTTYCGFLSVQQGRYK